MGGGQDGLAVAVIHRLVAQAEPVTADDFLRLGIPQDQLAVAVCGIGVELVDIQRLTRTAAVVAEGNLAQAADLLDDVHGVRTHDIQFVSGAVRLAQVSVGVEFRLQEFPVDGRNDFLHNRQVQYRLV